MEVIKRVARVNKVTLPTGLDEFEDQQQEDLAKDEPREGPLQLLKYPTMVVRFLILIFNWYVRTDFFCYIHASRQDTKKVQNKAFVVVVVCLTVQNNVRVFGSSPFSGK